MSDASEYPPHTLRRSLMRQRWADLTYLHWPLAPDQVAERIPEPLEPDLFDGSAWVGLVPFQMEGIGLSVGPSVPYFGSFPETNVRTYVVGPNGPGVWFDSLDAGRLAAVGAARVAFGLPYMWSAMSIERGNGWYRYRTKRRWGGPDATSDVTVRLGTPVPSTDLDVFLTARWRLYSQWRFRVVHAPVEHPPWDLRRAEAQVGDTLVTAAGYEISGEPHVRFARGVPVQIGRPRFV